VIKKILIIFMVSLFFIVFSQQAHAFVEGEWDMTIIEKVTATVKKIAAAKYTDNFSDTWSLSTNGQFAVDGLPLGTWYTVKKKFVVDLDESILSVILANNLQDEGFPGDTIVTVTSAKGSGTMNKNGSIKGTYKIVGIISTSGKTGKLTVNGKFTGVKIADNTPVDGTTFTISEYFPLEQGNTWTYIEEDNQLTVQRVSGTQKINGVNAIKVIDEDGDYFLYGNTNGFLWYEQYDADDIPGCGWEKQILDPPVKFCDSVVSVGSTYASTTTLKKTDCKGNSASIYLSYGFTIEGIEDVTVPAGTFNDCLKITGIITVNGSTQTNEQYIWLAKGLGQVKSISVDKDNGSIINTWTDDLVSAVVGGVHYP
jgi:hypothetical protein